MVAVVVERHIVSQLPSATEVASSYGLSVSSSTLPFNVYSSGPSGSTSCEQGPQVGLCHFMWHTTVKMVCKNKKHRACNLMLLQSWYGAEESIRLALEWISTAASVSEDEHWQSAQALIRAGKAIAASARR